MLAVTRYAPNPVVIYSHTKSDIPLDAIDSTNLQITFTAPSTGNVMVNLKAWQDVSGSGSMLWGLIESGADVAGASAVVNRDFSTGDLTTLSVYISGLTPGSSHTYLWGWSNGDTMRLFAGDGTSQDGGAHIWAPAIMEVWKAP